MKPLQRYDCQVCGFFMRVQSLDELKDERGSWCLHGYSHAEGNLQVLTCPGCSWLGDEKIMQGYMKRVAEGHDLRFH